VSDEETGLAHAWARFWFSPADPFGLHLLRLLTGLMLLAWLLPLAGEVPALFGLRGWFDRQAYVEAARLQMGAPKPIGWSLLYLAGSSSTALLAVYWASVAILLLFTAGVATRLTAILTWVVVVSFTASPALDSELDPLLQLFTIYLALGYLLLGLRDWKLSWPARILGSRDCLLLGRLFRRPEGAAGGSIAANLALRLVQVHFAIVITMSGLHKLQIGEWWSGVAHWFAIYPAMATRMAQAREHAADPITFLSLLNVAAYATLAWQLTFPLFAWRTGWSRGVLLGGAVVGWAGLVYFYHMPLMGMALAIACLTYLSSADWSAVGQALQRVSSLKRIGSWLVEQPERDWPAPTPASPAREPAGSLHAIRER
jgi:hypothetical protein